MIETIEILRREWVYLWYYFTLQLGQIAPYYALGIVLGSVINTDSTALGGVALAVRIISCFLCGIAAGLFIRGFYRDRSFFDFTGFDEPQSRDTDPNLIMRLPKNIGRNIKATALWFLVGISNLIV